MNKNASNENISQDSLRRMGNKSSKSPLSSKSPHDARKAIHYDRLLRLAGANAFFRLMYNDNKNEQARLTIRDLIVLDYILMKLQLQYVKAKQMEKPKGRKRDDKIDFMRSGLQRFFDNGILSECNMGVQQWIQFVINEIDELRSQYYVTTMDNEIDWEAVLDVNAVIKHHKSYPFSTVFECIDEKNWEELKELMTKELSYVNVIHSADSLANQLMNPGIPNYLKNFHVRVHKLADLIEILNHDHWNLLLAFEHIDLTHHFSHLIISIALINEEEYLSPALNPRQLAVNQESHVFAAKILNMYDYRLTRPFVESCFHASKANSLMVKRADEQYRKFQQSTDKQESSYLFNSCLNVNDNDVITNKNESATDKIKNSTPNRKPTLVLDLDETLIHANMNDTNTIGRDFNFMMPDTSDTSLTPRMFDVCVYTRPYVEEFLDFIGQHFEVFLFTASLQHYADPIVDKIDPNRVISKRFYRPNCTTESELGIPVTQQGNFYVKDLRRLNRDLKQVAILDNAVYAYAFQFDNGIPIRDYKDEIIRTKRDLELLDFIPFLNILKDQPDFQAFLRYTFRVDDLQKVAQTQFKQN